LIHLVSQALERNTEELSSYANLLVVGPPEQDVPSLFSAATVVTHNYRVFRSLPETCATKIQFGLLPITARFDAAIVYMPKAKEELRLLLDYACAHLARSGVLYLIGAKKEGVQSGAKQLATRAKQCAKLDSAKHCQFWIAEDLTPLDGFDIQRYVTQHTMTIAGTSMLIAGLPGIFNAGKLDEGTEFLLAQQIKRLKNRTLDFGCGAGLIACAVKKLNPDIEIEAVDISWLALICCQRSFDLNGLKGKVYPSDGWSDVTGRVNGVVTNPPFHQGVSTEYQTTETFIKQAKDKMAKYAPFYLVANNFLKYPSIIESTFGACTTVSKNDKFTVYYAER
jgi:16S rRNA (guanine1207-N2)-methyltransferase